MRELSILFVNLFYPEKHPTIGFPVNVESLAGDLAGAYGNEVETLVLDMQQPGVTPEHILETIRNGSFDIVGISVKTGQRAIAEGLIEGIAALDARNRPGHVLVGGYRPRVFHDEFAEKYDHVLVCIGEGEPTMRGMVEHLRGRRELEDIPNLVYREAGELKRTGREQHDLNEWHPPGTTTLPYVLEAGGVVYLETSRGCTWGKCTFCSRKFSSGTKPSTVPPKRVASSWADFQRLGVRHVYCSDEDFLMSSHTHGQELSKALIEAGVNIEFWVQTTVDGVLQLGRAAYEAAEGGVASRRLRIAGQDPLPVEITTAQAESTLTTLQRAGLRRIFFGLESGSATQLERYRKGVSPAQGARAVHLCRDLGLEVEVGFIPLDPLVTIDELRETIGFVRKHDLVPAIVKVLNLMCVQKGVAMYAKTAQAGLLSGPRDEETFLFPYDFMDPRAGEIAEQIKRWQRHGLSEFTYALRRIVDADPNNEGPRGFLMQLRDLEFEFLAALAGAEAGEDERIYEGCMAQRLSIMQECMDSVARGAMLDPNGFLEVALEDSLSEEGVAWMGESETADVLRL